MSFSHSGICKIFASGGNCRFGTNCRFLHFRPPDPINSTATPFYQDAVNYSQQAVYYPQVYTNPQQGFYQIPSNDRPVCNFFVKNGFCDYGQSCRFSHDVASNGNWNVSFQGSYSQHPKRNDSNRICNFFQKGTCRFGSKCRYSHVVSETSDELAVDGSQAEVAEPAGVPPELPQQQAASVEGEGKNNSAADASKEHEKFGPQHQIKKDELTEEMQKEWRDREMEVVKKRYPSVEQTNSDDGATQMMFTFHPSDPDWPYDANSVTICLVLPPLYPLEQCSILVQEDGVIPRTVCDDLESSMNLWLRKRFNHLSQLGKVELMFRSFLKWLDREAEELFTDALKAYQKQLQAEAAGLEFVSASTLRSHYQASQAGNGEKGEEAEDDGQMEEGDGEEGEMEMERRMKELSLQQENNAPSTNGKLEPAARGTEIYLQSLALRESSATLACPLLSLRLQCLRCTHNTEVETPGQRVNKLGCPRCNQLMLVIYRPALCHQFSSVLGYLDLDQCKAVDLVLPKCKFTVNCLGCNKDMNFQGIMSGSCKSSWCHSCHAKLSVELDTVKFHQLQQSSVEAKGAHNVPTQKLVKNVKDPAIQQGKPLPDNGVCKHFKRSYRWFRFPCCGKAYPCDACHDDIEDHEMKLASRVICGYCAKEQSYSSTNPCVACHAWMTKRSTDHWEGGKGCRDQVKMSRNDAKKYANTNKTASNKKVKSKQ